MISRRQWLLRVAAPVGAGLAFRARPARSQEGADPLRMPGAVQQRETVTSAQNNETVTGIERRLKCTCGCNLDVFTCRTTDFTCGTSPAMHKEVVALLESGNTPDQVVAAFVAQYGEEVLMAPTPEGFNLAGYLVPGLALLIAGGTLAAVLLRRHRLGQAAEGPAMAGTGGRDVRSVPGVSDAEMARLEQALLDVDR